MTHADIIARLTAATGPDEELAVDIYQALDICSYIPDEGDPTASVDACLALIERVLPGWEWTVGDDAALGKYAGVYQSNMAGGAGFSEDDIVRGTTVPLAALLALFRALEAQEAV